MKKKRMDEESRGRADTKKERREKNIVRADGREQTVVSNETVCARVCVCVCVCVCAHSLELSVCRVLALVQYASITFSI